MPPASAARNPEVTLAKPCSVLIVEDDPLIQEVFESILTREGCEVSLASDGASMRNACATRGFDVVILDIALPGGVNGLQLAREAAALGCGIVLITGHHDLYEPVARSGYRHLFKPFRVEALLQAIQDALPAHTDCTMRGRSREA